MIGINKALDKFRGLFVSEMLVTVLIYMPVYN
ncbi:hypothetical protein VP381E491_P0054 [Vibrio phage 381E49-1]|nr:hypothetical protein VP381E491_P0054 [Vibrio phage 381E49-1]